MARRFTPFVRFAGAVAATIALVVCAEMSAIDPPNTHPYAIPVARRERWWRLAESCSGKHSRAIRHIRYYEWTDSSAALGDQYGHAKGAIADVENFTIVGMRYALEDSASMIHEYLHFLWGLGHDPEVARRCGSLTRWGPPWDSR